MFVFPRHNARGCLTDQVLPGGGPKQRGSFDKIPAKLRTHTRKEERTAWLKENLHFVHRSQNVRGTRMAKAIRLPQADEGGALTTLITLTRETLSPNRFVVS